MAEFPPLQLPGEPDPLAEVRLRAELKILRSVATSIERIEAMTRLPPREVLEKGFPPLPPPPPEIWQPEAVADRIIATAPLERIKPQLKERLLTVEALFVGKGWHLPKWERPSWLLE